MSIQQIEARVCDVTGALYEGQAEWMTLVHRESGQEFDFSNFDALEKWVTDEEVPGVPDVDQSDVVGVSEDGMEVEYAIPEEIAQAARAQEPVVDTTQPEPRPAMTLADAIMLGQKPGFDPTLQRSDDATRGRG